MDICARLQFVLQFKAPWYIYFLLLLVLALMPKSFVFAAESERWRFGVGVATQNMVDGTTTTNLNLFEGYRPGDEPWNPLGLGWYFNWNWKQRYGAVCGPNGCIEYMPLVGGWGPGVNPSIETIRAYVLSHPNEYPDGTTWLIGNEIIWDDRRTPEQYARDYHDFYYGLKSINPTFKIASGSVITSVTYNRPGFTGTPIELMNAIRTAYQSIYGEPWPVDVYNIHPYVWTKPTLEQELADLQSQISTFRDWMKSIGEQDKPLIITEYGLSNYHDPQWMIDYLLGSFQILLSKGHSNGMPSDEGRWVQRWAWFVNNNHVWQAGGEVQWTHCALYNGDTFDVRPLGRAYARHPHEYNYAPQITDCSLSSNVLLADESTPYSVTVKVTDGNGVGDIRSVRVILYNGSAWQASNGRGYLAWGQDDYDITDFGETWMLMGNASGDGRWAWCSGDWGENNYIVPISASASTNGNERTITFTFAAKPSWAPSFNQKFRVYVRDGGGSPTGWIEQPLSYCVLQSLSFGSAHNNPDGTTVTIPCAVVSAGSNQLANTAYVQALDRSAGIKVYGSNINARAGDVVSISGKIQTSSGERIITYPTLTVLATGGLPPKPMFITCRDVGGESPNAFTPGTYQGVGLYNVGLLATIAGKVTYSDAASKLFYVDDGSGRGGSLGDLGIKVSCSGLTPGNTIEIPNTNSFVIVSGVMATQMSSGQVFPVIRPRSSVDVIVF